MVPLLITFMAASPARANDSWTTTGIITSTATHIPVGVAVGSYDANDDVLLAVEWKTQAADSSTSNHYLQGQTENCTNSSCSAYTTTQAVSQLDDFHVTGGPIAPGMMWQFAGGVGGGLFEHLLGNTDDTSGCTGNDAGRHVDLFSGIFGVDWSGSTFDTVSSDTCFTYGHTLSTSKLAQGGTPVGP